MEDKMDGLSLLLCPKCRKRCRIRSAEREGEGEDEHGNLVGTHCIEAWAECPDHGWISPKMELDSWSEEVPQSEPCTERHRLAAEEGVVCLMTRTTGKNDPENTPTRASTRVLWAVRGLGYGVADVIRTDRYGREEWCIRVWGDFMDCATAKREALKVLAQGNT